MQDKASLVRAYILDLLEQGRVAARERIPSARELCGLTEVSFVIVQSAIEALCKDGVLEAAPRRGTFVREGWQERALPEVCVPFGTRLPWLEAVEPYLQAAGLRLSRSFRRGMFEVRTTYELQRDQRDFLDLSPYFAQLFPEREVFFDAPLRGFRNAAGKLFGIPMIFSPRVMFFNPRMLQAAGCPLPQRGWAWADFLAAVRRLRAGLPGEQVLNWVPAAYLWMNFVFRAGGSLIAPDAADPVRIDSPQTMLALRLYAELREELGVTVAQMRNRDHAESFCAGRLALLIGTREDLCRIARSGMDEWGTAPLPLIPGGTELTAQATDLLCVRRECRDDGAIRAFLQTMLSQEVQDELGRMKYGIPLRKSSAAASMNFEDARDALFLQEMSKISAEYRLDSPELSQLVLEGINQILEQPQRAEEYARELAGAVRVFLRIRSQRAAGMEAALR